jgi:hypothetical protein
VLSQPLVCLFFLGRRSPLSTPVVDTYGYAGAIDVGDGFVTFKDSLPIYTLRLLAAPEDSGMEVLIGNDEAGRPDLYHCRPDCPKG